MAQIIRHRRGSLESLSAATASFQKGELIIVSGSSNLTTTNGAGMVFAATESGSVQAVNRFLVGNNAPNVFSSSTYNGLVKGVPYYASGSSTLYLLGSDGNDIPDLTGNISNFSASVSTSINALSASIGSGTIGNSVTLLNSKTGSYATTGSNTFDGTQTINNGELIIQSGSNPQIRLINDTTNVEYHIQNGNGGNFQIHREVDGENKLLFLFQSSSLDYGNPDAYFYSKVFVSESITAPTLLGNIILGTRISASVGFSGSINGIGDVSTFSASVDSRFSASVASVTSLSASVASVTGDFSSSVAQTFTTQSARITSLESFSGSQLTQNTALATITGSLISSASTAKTTNDTQDIKLSNLESKSSSVDISIANINSFSSSQLTQNTALATVTGSLISSASAAAVSIANLNANSGSYAVLSGSNVFYGQQVITGSLYITQDLIVQGSSSLQNVTASAVNIGTNQLNLNTAFPSVRYAGVNVYDSGSSGVSASLQWDSLNDQWIFVHQESGSATVDSSILLYGPLSNGGLGSEATLAGNFLTKVENNGHGHHLTTSSIEDTGTNVIVHNSLGVSGSIIVNNAIVGTGSIYLQPDIADARQVQIYNTGASDVHIKGTTGLTFLGDDTNYVAINDSAQTVTVKGVNGVFIETGLNVTGPISSSAGFSGSIEGIGNVTAYSSSVSASIAAVVANVGTGVGVSITNLNSFSSSALGRLSNIELFSSSVETQLTQIGVVSGSLIASASAAKTTNDTQDGRLTSLETTSASVNTSVTALNSSSASQQISIDALNVVSSSNLGRLTNLESTSASVNTSVTNINLFSSSVLTQLTEIGVVSGSLITSASTAKTTNDTQDGRLTNLESKSSSVDISVAALNSYTSSNTSTTALNAHTASANERFTEIGVVSGSLIASASVAKTTNDSQGVSITNINSFSSSVLTQLTEIGVVSGSLIASASAAKTTNDSQDVSITNLNSFSASVNTSVAALNSSSASQQISIDALNSYTSSNTSTTALNAHTASANERFTEIGVVSGSLISSASAAAVANANQNLFTQSAETRFTEIGVVSGSLIASASAAKTTNDSQDVSITNINSTTASLNTSVTALNSSSASQQISIDALNVVSSSNLGRLTNLETTSASVNTSVAALNSYSSSLKIAFELTGSNVVVLGDLTVRGTTTSVDSNTIQLGDNIIELNGTGAANGGLLVKDPTAPNTVSGSLLWDSTNDYWKAGALGSESKLLRAEGDNVVSGGAQIPIADLDGYADYNDNILLEFSASNASITSLSASVASVTGDFSSSVATSFSASNASITALSASVASVTGDFSSSVATSFSASVASQTLLSSSFASSQATQNGRLDNLETTSGSLNSFSSSINTTIKTKLDVETVVSGSSQIDITSTTGYSTFSGSIATSVSASNARITALETTIDGGTY